MKIEFYKACRNGVNIFKTSFYHRDYESSYLLIRKVDGGFVADEDCHCKTVKIAENVKLTVETCSNGYIVKSKETIVASTLYDLQNHIKELVEHEENAIVPLSEFNYDQDQLLSVIQELQLPEEV